MKVQTKNNEYVYVKTEDTTPVIINVSGNVNTTGAMRVGTNSSTVETLSPTGGCNMVYNASTKSLNFEF